MPEAKHFKKANNANSKVIKVGSKIDDFMLFRLRNLFNVCYSILLFQLISCKIRKLGKVNEFFPGFRYLKSTGTKFT